MLTVFRIQNFSLSLKIVLYVQGPQMEKKTHIGITFRYLLACVWKNILLDYFL